MPALPSRGVLGVANKRLMGDDIRELKAVLEYLIGRSATTHDIARYALAAKAALNAAHPEIPANATKENWQSVADSFVAAYGETFELLPALEDVLADDKSSRETLHEMAPNARIVTLHPPD